MTPINDVKLDRFKNLWSVCWVELKQLCSIAEEFTKQLNPYLYECNSETANLMEITKPVEIINIPMQSVNQPIFTTVSESLHKC